ncbi:MAG: nucleotidyltransferase family protein [Bryobacterales bacterium]|nr:nucleotidyltransferase family protein [Bryobacterales bacterium]
MKFAALILAGGASRRMGRPKALLPYSGATFADRLVRVYASCCDPVILVLGHQHESIRKGLQSNGLQSNARIVVNPDPERGQLSSMQCGLQVMPADIEGFVFTPVDYPAVREDTVHLLLNRMHEANAKCAIPRHEGRKGHPVACHASLIAEFLTLPADGQARDVVRRHRDETIYVDVEDPGIVNDVDDPAAYERLLAEVAPS